MTMLLFVNIIGETNDVLILSLFCLPTRPLLVTSVTLRVVDQFKTTKVRRSIPYHFLRT